MSGIHMSEKFNACVDAKVSQTACHEALTIEKLANHDEFFQPSYPVERNDLLQALTKEINSLSATQLKDVAKVHERIVSRTGHPPTNGGVDFDANGNISGLTFVTAENPLDVQWRANDK